MLILTTAPLEATLRMQHIINLLFNKNRHPHPLLSVVFKRENQSQQKPKMRHILISSLSQVALTRLEGEHSLSFSPKDTQHTLCFNFGLVNAMTVTKSQAMLLLLNTDKYVNMLRRLLKFELSKIRQIHFCRTKSSDRSRVDTSTVNMYCPAFVVHEEFMALNDRHQDRLLMQL